jgi:competence ComEA-like helix-hairpin-helix protein
LKLHHHLAPAELRLAILFLVLTFLSLLWKGAQTISPEVQAWLDTPWPVDSSQVVSPVPPKLVVELESVDINTATPSELVTLPGIGPAFAQRIVDYRAQHGPYESLEALVRVRGIGTGTLEKLRPFLKPI